MDTTALGKHLGEIAVSHPKLVRVDSVCQSAEKRDVWLVELGAGGDKERTHRPAMLVVAGIEGNDVAGCAAAVTWIERLVGQYETNEEIRRLLDTTTLYVFPRVNPDAAAHFFAEKAVIETDRTAKAVDDDHDALVDEDPPEDLNGDGRITWMRVEDPEGAYILDPAEPRLLIEADAVEGEVGAWRLLPEGRDNDEDEKWNEDPRGGVNFNRNFPFEYPWFAPDAGVHQVSEPETRVIADFAVGHPNIGVIFTFGAADNLGKTPESGGKSGRGRPMTEIHEEDLPYYRRMGEIYRETLGLKQDIEGASPPGTFSDWMYFHRGRLSLATRPWSPAMQLALEKAEEDKAGESEDKPTSPGTTAEEQPTSPTAKGDDNGKKEEEERNKEERDFLEWIDENDPDRYLAWQKFDHPDFPGKHVEIGGYAPFAKTAPPESILDDLVVKHADFLTTLALKLPRVAIRKMESKHLGNSVYEVEIQVENRGYLPTMLAHGEVTREIHATRIGVDLDDEALLSGTRTARLPTLEGSGGEVRMRYILHVPDRREIKVTVVSMLGGTVEATQTLDGEKQP
jgi:hypothetical protein